MSISRWLSREWRPMDARQHVERADQRGAQRGRQVDPLRLAARQRRRQPIERQVVEADVAQERQPPFDFASTLSRRPSPSP
jgi:hypothetical protein